MADALEALTGQREIDASALVEYIEPLQSWPEKQDRGRKVGF